MNIYFDDGVQPSTCVHTCSTLAEAKKLVSEQLQGITMVDADHPCSGDVIASSRTAKYMVFDGEPITLDEDDIPHLTEPIYESDYFYTI